MELAYLLHVVFAGDRLEAIVLFALDGEVVDFGFFRPDNDMETMPHTPEEVVLRLRGNNASYDFSLTPHETVEAGAEQWMQLYERHTKRIIAGVV